MFGMLRSASVILIALTLITGILYPVALFGLSQLLFPHQANGSLIRDGQVGSEPIGQSFSAPAFMFS